MSVELGETPFARNHARKFTSLTSAHPVGAQRRAAPERAAPQRLAALLALATSENC
jgi:hypothetical protein